MSHAEPEHQNHAHQPVTAFGTAPRDVRPAVDAKNSEAPSGYRHRPDARALASLIAQTHQLDETWVWSVLSNARHQSQAARLVMPTPKETQKSWAAYRGRFVEHARIRQGRAFWREYSAPLLRASDRYGVPVEIILGILGVETMFGRDTGQFRVLDALATLSLDFPRGRLDRSFFFKTELGAFFKLCAEQALNPESVYGSYAGAIGWPQFMPSSIRRWGVDFDDDGKVDLQRSPVDAIGSVAHYLAQHGWQTGQPTHFKVTPPSDPVALEKLLAPDIRPTFSVNQMQALGAKLDESTRRHSGPLALVQLENGNGKPIVIAGTNNFYVVTRYNQSSYYALAVIELGQAIARYEDCLKMQRNKCL